MLELVLLRADEHLEAACGATAGVADPFSEKLKVWPLP
jgi:hypothetical protein